MFDEKDVQIIKFLQGDIPLESRPFKEMALSLQMSEEEVLERIKDMEKRGIMRRWGAVLRHQKAGYGYNAMVAWKAAPEEADQAGAIMAAAKEISHCYLREVRPDFAYNMFSMIHGRSAAELEDTIKHIAELTGLDDYTVLKSIREFKKVSMRFFA